MQNCTSANSSFVRFLHPLDAVFYAPLSSTFGAIGVRFERRCPRRARFERPKVFPNFKPGLEDMHLMRTQSGGFMMRDSWPPVLNYGFKPQDPIPPKGKNPRIPGTVKKYPMKYKGIEYIYKPALLPLPWGRTGKFGSELIRIDHDYIKKQKDEEESRRQALEGVYVAPKDAVEGLFK
eukprot:Platyproteum_vivax@DN5095_c0_g1_i2.p1